MTKKTGHEEKLTLAVSARDVLGKKVKKLRREGVLPANIYGEGFASRSVSVDATAFRKMFKKSGETQVVYLALEKGEELPVLVHHVQTHPVYSSILHVEFRKVDLKKKIETQVPVTLTGESEAVTQNKGILQTISDSILVEAYPDKIPTEINVDISTLKEVDEQILVKDLKAGADYEIKDDPDKVILRITEHKEEELTPQTEAVETEITEQKAEGEEVAAEGESAAEEKAEDAKPAEEEKKE